MTAVPTHAAAVTTTPPMAMSTATPIPAATRTIPAAAAAAAAAAVPGAAPASSASMAIAAVSDRMMPAPPDAMEAPPLPVILPPAPPPSFAALSTTPPRPPAPAPAAPVKSEPLPSSSPAALASSAAAAYGSPPVAPVALPPSPPKATSTAAAKADRNGGAMLSSSGVPIPDCFVETTVDALVLFQAARQGLVARASRRLVHAEKTALASGATFIYDEEGSGIRRWTDGRLWSPSRILDNFLIYRELDQKMTRQEGGALRRITPGSRSRSRRRHGGGSTAGPSDAEMDAATAAASSQPDADGETDGDIDPDAAGADMISTRRYVFRFKEGGLLKRTFSVQIDGHCWHLVNYVATRHCAQLPRPHLLPWLAALRIPAELVEGQSFRRPMPADYASRSLADLAREDRGGGGSGGGGASDSALTSAPSVSDLAHDDSPLAKLAAAAASLDPTTLDAKPLAWPAASPPALSAAAVTRRRSPDRKPARRMKSASPPRPAVARPHAPASAGRGPLPPPAIAPLPSIVTPPVPPDAAVAAPPSRPAFHFATGDDSQTSSSSDDAASHPERRAQRRTGTGARARRYHPAGYAPAVSPPMPGPQLGASLSLSPARAPAARRPRGHRSVSLDSSTSSSSSSSAASLPPMTMPVPAVPSYDYPVAMDVARDAAADAPATAAASASLRGRGRSQTVPPVLRAAMMNVFNRCMDAMQLALVPFLPSPPADAAAYARVLHAALDPPDDDMLLTAYLEMTPHVLTVATVRDRINTSYYKTPSAFVSDVYQLLDNAKAWRRRHPEPAPLPSPPAAAGLSPPTLAAGRAGSRSGKPSNVLKRPATAPMMPASAAAPVPLVALDAVSQAFDLTYRAECPNGIVTVGRSVPAAATAAAPLPAAATAEAGAALAVPSPFPRTASPSVPSKRGPSELLGVPNSPSKVTKA